MKWVPQDLFQVEPMLGWFLIMIAFQFFIKLLIFFLVLYGRLKTPRNSSTHRLVTLQTSMYYWWNHITWYIYKLWKHMEAPRFPTPKLLKTPLCFTNLGNVNWQPKQACKWRKLVFTILYFLPWLSNKQLEKIQNKKWRNEILLMPICYPSHWTRKILQGKWACQVSRN